MNNFFVVFSKKKIRNVKRIHIVIFFLLIAININTLFNCIFNTEYPISNLQTCEINAENSIILKTYSTVGSRNKLVITDSDSTYYLWYPIYKYNKYSYAVENELVSGNVSTVTAIVCGDQNLYDRIFKRYCIVDLRSDNYIFYDIEDERQEQIKDKYNNWLLLFVVFIIFLFYVSYVFILKYGVIEIKKKRKTHNTGYASPSSDES